MLFVVIGKRLSGKTYFIENRMNEIKNYDTKRRVKFFSAFQTDMTSSEFLNLVINHRHTSSEVDFDDMVIEVCGLNDLPLEVRNNAYYMIFTDYDNMQKYFIDPSHGGYSASIIKTITQVNKFHSERYQVCVWDNWNKKFI